MLFIQRELAQPLVVLDGARDGPFVEMLERQLHVDAGIGSVRVPPRRKARLVKCVEVRILELGRILCRPCADSFGATGEKILAVKLVIPLQRRTKSPCGIMPVGDDAKRSAAGQSSQRGDADANDDVGPRLIAAREK